VLLVSGVVFVLGEASINTLSIFFLRENLHASPALFGLMGGAIGLGTLLGAATGGFVASRIGSSRALWSAAIAFGCVTVVLSQVRTFPPALVLVAVSAAMFGVMEVTETPLLLRATPEGYTGRVAAILLPTFSVADSVAALAAGWLVATALKGLHASLAFLQLNSVGSVYALAGLLAFSAGIYTMKNLES
jgi:hypothetical protein